MKKQSKILSACLTLAIAGTTLVPAVSAAGPKKGSSAGKKVLLQQLLKKQEKEYDTDLKNSVKK